MGRLPEAWIAPPAGGGLPPLVGHCRQGALPAAAVGAAGRRDRLFSGMTAARLAAVLVAEIGEVTRFPGPNSWPAGLGSPHAITSPTRICTAARSPSRAVRVHLHMSFGVRP